jgi:hypothetical protein
MNINEIRLHNIDSIIRQKCGGNRSRFATSIGREAVSVGRWWTKSKHRRNVSDESAREIEVAFGLPKDWVDNLHENNSDLEEDPLRRTELKIIDGETFVPPLHYFAAIDNNLRLTLIGQRKGNLMMLSTDADVYAIQLHGHSPTDWYSDGYALMVEPHTPLTEKEYALIWLDNGELLLRAIVYVGEDMLIVRHPVTGVQETLPTGRVTKTEYAYIGIPPSKVKLAAA